VDLDDLPLAPKGAQISASDRRGAIGAERSGKHLLPDRNHFVTVQRLDSPGDHAS
jgi:hypothetical protein